MLLPLAGYKHIDEVFGSKGGFDCCYGGGISQSGKTANSKQNPVLILA